MHTPKGLERYPHFLTEEDVLRHAGLLIPTSEPSPVAPSAPDPVKSDPAEELSSGELIIKLERENTKDSLIAMAVAAGLDESGTKAVLAERLVSHYRSR